MKTVRLTVVEELIERTTIDIEIEDDFDTDGLDSEASHEAFEEVFVNGSYKEVPNTKEYEINERYFLTPKLLP